MITIIGVKFRKPGKVYYFAPGELEIKKGDHVIVETARGVEYGNVVLGPKQVTDDQVVQPLKPVIRIATPEDDKITIENEEKEKEAFSICLEKIRNRELEMKLIDSEYTFDRNKLLFYFTADGRIDFRELVKDLASVFHTRIELRQIGVRDETKILGGIGICGRTLCCHSYLSDFVPVSIKMAKEQNLSLNPSKISGACGRLMCCLKNEQEAYEYLNKSLPSVGATVETEDGFSGEVQSVSVLRQLVKIKIELDEDNKEVREYPVSELRFDPKKTKGKKWNKNCKMPEEALDEAEQKELEALSKEDEEETTAEKPQKKNNHHRGNRGKGNHNGRGGNPNAHGGNPSAHGGQSNHGGQNNHGNPNTHGGQNSHGNQSHTNNSPQSKGNHRNRNQLRNKKPRQSKES